ncbi:MAG: preprotein translocase subunit YajC [Cytophagales bacterium]|jgi:preprotein translocase subunit YajC
MYSILLQAQPQSSWISFLPMIGIIVVFYFFMIRPQQKKAKEQKKFSEEVKKGDYVITVGGVHGRVDEVQDETVVLEVERGGRIKFSKSSISMESTKAFKDKK